MKTLKSSFVTILVTLFVTFSFAQEPATVTLVSSKNIKDASELVVDFDGEIITDTWSKDAIVRIEIEIKADDVTREVIKHLIEKRRFVVRTLPLEDGTTLIYMPNVKLPAYINGNLVSESISYRLLVPENVLVKIKTWDDHKS